MAGSSIKLVKIKYVPTAAQRQDHQLNCLKLSMFQYVVHPSYVMHMMTEKKDK